MGVALNLNSISVGYNSHINHLVALGGKFFTNAVELESSWMTVRDVSKFDSPWFGLQIEPQTLPSRKESCVLQCMALFLNGLGFLVYGGTETSDSKEVYFNDIYHFTINSTANHLSIYTTNITKNILNYQKEHIIPSWSSNPSCLILNNTLYLIGIPKSENQNSIQSNSDRVVALDLNYPVSFYNPEKDSPKSNATFKIVFGAVVIAGVLLAVVLRRKINANKILSSVESSTIETPLNYQ
ncbi:hypothetical protein HK096_004460, partial [Nowakowskiella sp. JEL0078]